VESGFRPGSRRISVEVADRNSSNCSGSHDVKVNRSVRHNGRVVKGFCVPLVLALIATGGAAAPVQLDAMTSPEVQAAIAAGTTTILIPIGGTEQNGPHIALGKHNVRVAALAERIAAGLGRTLVAPVMAYVPEPEGHMKHAGTISVPEDAFAAVIAGAARSLKRHGFRDIVLLGDSGDYQPVLKRVAERLNREWAGSPARVHHLAAYYESSPHAGPDDTARLLAIDPGSVRPQALPAGTSAEQGRASVARTVDRSIAAIRQAVAAPR
jgi:creatinine amidohydrolase